MKLNLGKYLLILLLPLLLNAAHRWELEVSKTDLVIGEATLFSYTCFFEGEAYGTSIDIEIPAEHDDYSIEVYKVSENIINDNRQNHFQYVVFPKRSGEIEVSLKAELRKTSREQVENAVIGRDNVEYYQFEKAEDTLPSTSLHVSPIQTQLVGDFALHVRLDKEKLSAYEPLHVSIIFEGIGNLDQYKPFELDIASTDIFREKPERKYRLTPEGFKGSITQKFAIVSDTNFTFPKFSLEIYNSKLGKNQHLITHEKALHVKPAFAKKELLDPPQEDEEKPLNFSWIYYFLTLVTGVILGWYAKLYLAQYHNEKKQKSFTQAKDAKTLLTHLALEGGHEKLIEQAQNEKWS
ncbi:MAG: hypothetical protein U9R50_07065, partial [Campylobacterota bacterium]|nr:hypothetical protein [Campylobacterota bacterium]